VCISDSAVARQASKQAVPSGKGSIRHGHEMSMGREEHDACLCLCAGNKAVCSVADDVGFTC
jgi:hypothetical protein